MWYEPDRDHQRKEKDEFHIRRKNSSKKKEKKFPTLGFLQTTVASCGLDVVCELLGDVLT